MAKPVLSWDVDSVCIWLSCIGLGDKTEPFRENAVDGETLVSLTKEDLEGDLALSGLMAKKVLRRLEETQKLLHFMEPKGSDSDCEGGEALDEAKDKVKELREELEGKDGKIGELEAELEAAKSQIGELEGRLNGFVAQQQQQQQQQAQQYYQYPPPPQQYAEAERAEVEVRADGPGGRAGPGLVGGAAVGAAGGAMKGAILGAILPGMDASDGAAAGAAVGAATGGLRGLRNRRFG